MEFGRGVKLDSSQQRLVPIAWAGEAAGGFSQCQVAVGMTVAREQIHVSSFRRLLRFWYPPNVESNSGFIKCGHTSPVH